MPSYCWIALEHLDAGDKRSFQQMIDEMPPGARWQLEAGYFDEISRHCAHRIQDVQSRRPGNVMTFEGSWNSPRCLRQSPDGRGAIYWLSGGDAVAYGRCCLANCPLGRSGEESGVQS